jgi:hypothetical protein
VNEQEIKPRFPPSPVELDKEFRDIIWRAMIMIVRAYAKRYGYDIAKLKENG